MSAIKSNIEYLHAECRLIVSAKDSTTKHSLVTLCDKHPNVASIPCYPDEDEKQKLIYETLIQNNIDISSHLTEYISNKLEMIAQSIEARLKKLVYMLQKQNL